MTDFQHGLYSKSSRPDRSPLERDSNASKQTDTKLKSYFKDIIEERRTTQESLPEGHGRFTKPDTSLYSGLSITKSDLYDIKLDHDEEKDDGLSNNTSALLEENLDDEDDDLGIKEKPKKKYSWDDSKEDRISKVETKRERDHKKGSGFDYIPEHRKTENTDESLDDSYENPYISKGSSNKKDYNMPKSRDYRDERLSSDKKVYESVMTEDFISEREGSSVKKRKQSEEQGLQISKKNIEFGILYPTERREETVELFNRGNEDMRLDLKVNAQRSGVKFYIGVEEGELRQETLLLVINKYSFKKVRVSVEIGSFGAENERDRDLNGVLTIKTGESHERHEIPLNCKLENPSLQILDTSIDKMVGNVPFVNIDMSKLGISEEVQIPFRNSGKRQLLLEFELVSNPKLADVIFSPKYLTLKEGEEKTIGIRPIRSFDYENKRKAILKYRIKGTNLCQCIVVNLL